MAGIKDKMGKLKNWMIVDGDNANDEYDAYDEYEDDTYEDDAYDEYEAEEEEEASYNNPLGSRMDYQAHNQMKVIIVEPKVYNDAATIADHLRLRKTVIVNLEALTEKDIKRSIFDFMSGAVYVLDGSIQRVSRSIFILAPKNVDVDASIKKELESKAIFPWQNK